MMLLSELYASDERYAFIYSKNIDDRFINFYDKVVVEADAIDNIYAIRYPNKMVAYVSLGEIEPWRKTKVPYDKSWVISKNKTWNSLIADLNQEAYQTFIFERIQKLYRMGYRNFFLDTMDAYHVTAKDKALFTNQQKALISFIKKLDQRYPKANIIINRGFELLDEIHPHIEAVVAESLLARYDHPNKSYVRVPKEDYQWLLAQFQKAQKLGLDAISIEYTNRSSQSRLNIAKEVKALGITPYVTDGLLQEQGECHVERIRRDVLILFNQSIIEEKKAVYSSPHLSISVPIEHYGYVPILHDLSSKELPKRVEDKYHSVIIWLHGETRNDAKLNEWIEKVRTQNIKILFFDNFATLKSNQELETLGLSRRQNPHKLTETQTIYYDPNYKPFEIPYKGGHLYELIEGEVTKAILKVNYDNGDSSTPTAITSWGGYALSSSFLLTLGNKSFWTIDPYQFIKEALRFDEIPMPDPTTESGRRILFIHIDGDGFMEPVRMDMEMFSTEYLLEHVYNKYQIPHTLSIIQGEVEKLYPKDRERMENITRQLYALPWVQPASHTYSHPFFWGDLGKNNHDVNEHFGKHYHLPIQGYKFSLKTETVDSINYTLSFAPKQKRNEKIIFWSGDCQPSKEVLEYVEKNGILHMNGGDTTIQKKSPTIQHIAPFGLQHDEYWQIYTGQQNENVYTNHWLGPFWGFRNVIETFKMTNKPYRVKPINIYYHFYAASKLASFNALLEIYEWAIQQKTSKLYASQYIKKAQGFYRTALGKTEEGFEVRNQGHLRTLRFDKKIDLNIQKSQGLAGHHYENTSSYVTLDRSGHYQLNLKKNNHSPYLIESNGWVEKIDVHNNQYTFILQANVPLEAKFHLPKSCTVTLPNHFKMHKIKQILTISSEQRKGAKVVLLCQ
jgi:hypothetical protein